MKNKKLKTSKKGGLLTLFILLLVGVGLGSYYLKFVKDDPVAISQEQQKTAEQADVDAAKQRVEEDSRNEPLKDGGNTDSETVASGPITLSNLTFSQSGGLVNSTVNVSGAESGNCIFTFTDSDGRAITKSAKLNNGKCELSTSEAEFSMIGEYDLAVKFADKSISKTVSIN